MVASKAVERDCRMADSRHASQPYRSPAQKYVARLCEGIFILFFKHLYAQIALSIVWSPRAAFALEIDTRVGRLRYRSRSPVVYSFKFVLSVPGRDCKRYRSRTWNPSGATDVNHKSQ